MSFPEEEAEGESSPPEDHSEEGAASFKQGAASSRPGVSLGAALVAQQWQTLSPEERRGRLRDLERLPSAHSEVILEDLDEGLRSQFEGKDGADAREWEGILKTNPQAIRVFRDSP